MTAQAQPLSEDARPSGVCPEDCPNKQDGHCPDHNKMERSRIFGVAYLKFGTWFVGIGVLILIGVLSALSNRVEVVEGRVIDHIEGSNDKLDQIHHSVMTMEFNMRNDFENRGEEFTELKYMEEY